MINLRKPNSLFLNLNLITFGASQLFLYTLIPLIVSKSGLSFAQVILTFAVGTLLYFFGSLYWSKKADTKNPWLILFISSIGPLISVTSVALLFIHQFDAFNSFLILLIGRSAHGMLAAGLPPVCQNIRINETDRILKSSFAHSAALNIGRALGPCLMFLPFQSESLVIGFMGWTLILIFINLAQIKRAYKKLHQHKDESFFKGLRDIERPAMVTLAFTLILGFIHSGLAMRIQTILSLGPGLAGKFMAKLLLIASIIMVCAQLLSKNFNDNRWREILIAGAFTITTGLLSLLFAKTVAVFYLGIVLFSLGMALIHPANVLFMEGLKLSPNTRGMRLGQLAGVNTLGHALGSSLLGLSPDHFQILGIVLILFLILVCRRSVFQSNVEVSVCCQ